MTSELHQPVLKPYRITSVSTHIILFHTFMLVQCLSPVLYNIEHVVFLHLSFASLQGRSMSYLINELDKEPQSSCCLRSLFLYITLLWWGILTETGFSLLVWKKRILSFFLKQFLDCDMFQSINSFSRLVVKKHFFLYLIQAPFSKKCLPVLKRWVGCGFSSGCSNKLLQSGWLIKNAIYFSQSLRLKSPRSKWQ